MKYGLTTTAIALAMSVAANAATTIPPTLWVGDMFITVDSTSASGACGGAGIATGDSVQAIFAPKNLPGNSTTTDQFSAFFRRGSAILIVPSSGTFSSTTSQNSAFTVIDGVTTLNKTSTMKPVSVSPAELKIIATTPSVTISFSVSGFLVSGCNATFKGALGLRPGNWPPLMN